MITISLCILAKNEASSIRSSIMSVTEFVNEIIIVDDHSTDSTREVAGTFAPKAKVFSLPFEVKDRGFGEAVTWMHQQATGDWILMIDCDELVSEGHLLHTLTRYPEIEAWALPRRKWENFAKNKRTELESYPDWQLRFFKRKPEHIFKGEMHTRFQGKSSFAYKGPYIEHLQSEGRSPEKLAHRDKLYPELAKQQGVAIHGGRLLEK